MNHFILGYARRIQDREMLKKVFDLAYAKVLNTLDVLRKEGCRKQAEELRVELYNKIIDLQSKIL